VKGSVKGSYDTKKGIARIASHLLRKVRGLIIISTKFTNVLDSRDLRFELFAISILNGTHIFILHLKKVSTQARANTAFSRYNTLKELGIISIYKELNWGTLQYLAWITKPSPKITSK